MRLIVTLFCALLAGPAAAASPGDVIISEIEWAGSQANSGDEWIELYNTTGFTVDLTGWRLTESSGGAGTVLSGSIQAHGFYVIEARSGAAISDLSADLNISSFNVGLSNSGEQLALLDPASNVIDQAGLPGTAWFAGVNSPAGVQDYSMERRLGAGSGVVASSWETNNGLIRAHLDSGGNPLNATPGAANSGFEVIMSGPTAVPALASVTDPPIRISTTVVAGHLGLTVTPDSVVLHTRRGGGPWDSRAMSSAGEGSYFYDWTPDEAALIEYYVTASAEGHTVPAAPPSQPDYFGIYDRSGLPCISPHRMVDAAGAILNPGQAVMVGGAATTQNPLFSGAPNDFRLEDACLPAAAISVQTAGGTRFAVSEGDSLVLIGRMDQLSGLTEVQPKAVAVVSVGNPLTPSVTTLAAIASNPEAFESRLVRVNACSITGGAWPTAGVDAELTITDGTASMTMFVDADTDVDGSSSPATSFSLVAIMDQFDTVSPYTSGYRLSPRRRTDIQEQTVSVAPRVVGQSRDARFTRLPNPLRPGSAIDLMLSGDDASHVILDVFDLGGRRLARLLDGAIEPGARSVIWPGRYAGVVFLRLSGPFTSRTAHVVALH